MEQAPAHAAVNDAAAQPLPRLAVVDVETNGLSTRRHRILQVAVVTIVDGSIVDEWSSLVHLDRPWRRVGPRRVHGIRRSDLRRAPRSSEVLDEFRRRIADAVFVAHNAAFDWAFLQRLAADDRCSLQPTPRLCTLQLSRRLDPERERSHRLGDVAARYGIVNDRPHDALHDARTTALVLPHLLDEHHVTTAHELEVLYEPE